mgnify:CR=1 FL=1
MGRDFQRNKNINFKTLNIIDYDSLNELQEDTVSLIEVIEHIPTNILEKFLNKTASLIKINGSLIITVPHKNKTLQKKHYQHFSFQSLKDCLPDNFKIIKTCGLESMALPFHLRLIRKLMESKFHYFETKFTNKRIIEQLTKKVS